MARDHGRSTPHSRRGRAPLALVVYDPPAEELGAPIDWSAWYLTDEENRSGGIEQRAILRAVQSSLTALAEERGWTNTVVAHGNFFAWVRNQPLVRVSPDVYLLDRPPAPPWPKTWETWVPGHKPPRWALKMVSGDWKRDYEINPPKFAQLGTRELVLFDPAAAAASSDEREGSRRDAPRTRAPLHVFRRGEDGALVLVYRGDGPAFCEQISASLVVQRDGERVMLRVARDEAGVDLVPTVDERAKAARERAKVAQESARTAQGAAKAAEEIAKAAHERAHNAEKRAQAAKERSRSLEADLVRARSDR